MLIPKAGATLSCKQRVKIPRKARGEKKGQKMTQQDKNNEMIAKIVSAFAKRADVTAAEIAELTLKLTHELERKPGQDHKLERKLGQDNAPAHAATSPAAERAEPDGGFQDAETTVPAIAIEDAVTPSKVFCLCCGKGFSTLKRHLGAIHGLTEAEYRERFDLPKDFPLVAPNYSKMKSAAAKEWSLGKYERANVDPVD